MNLERVVNIIGLVCAVIFIAICISIFMSGCNFREQLDIGSANAVKELQEGHNELITVLQHVATGQEKLCDALVEQHPDVPTYRSCSVEANRTSAQAAGLNKAQLDPYSRMGDLGGLLDKLSAIISPEGIAAIVTMILAGYGINIRGKAKANLQLAKDVAEMKPEEAKAHLKNKV